MRRGYSFWFGAILLSLLAVRPVLAISPTFLIVYGEALLAPVVIHLDTTVPSAFLWDAMHRGGAEYQNGTMQRDTVPTGLSGRRYVNVAIFWGVPSTPQARPEDASQHARLYLPTASEPAVIEATAPYMDQPGARPIPDDLGGFIAGWSLTADDLAAARRLGIPGL